MNEFKDAKEEYRNTPLPAELESCVQAGLRQGKAAYRKRRAFRRSVISAAACFAVLLAGLNLSPGFAAAAAEAPVLGGLFQILTIRSFTDGSGDRTVDVTQPGVTGSDFADRVSAEIQQRVEEKLTEAERIVADTKAAFLATGGTEEEWTARGTTVKVDYTVKSQTDTTVSFVINSYVDVASAYQEQFFYNLDLTADRELTLRDVLGENWVNICNDAIRAQMAAAEDPTVFFDGSMGGFSTVDETTSFYLNQEGEAVVVFPRATVAVGAMGTVEFAIGS